MTILLLWHKFRKNINIYRFYVPFLKILFLTLGETLFPTRVWPVGLRLLLLSSSAVSYFQGSDKLLSSGLASEHGRGRICTKNDFKAIKPGTFILATRNQKYFYKEKYKSSGTLRRASSHQRVAFCQGNDAEVLPSLAACPPHVRLGNFGPVE